MVGLWIFGDRIRLGHSVAPDHELEPVPASPDDRFDCFDLLSHADKPEDEDTFLLGPDVIAHIERKQALMREHWLDAQDYFVTPNK